MISKGITSRQFFSASIIAVLFVALAAPTNAFANPSKTEISLIIDCSGSITNVQADFDTMLDGYVQAFNNPAIQGLLSAGAGTSIEVIFFSTGHAVVIPHTHVEVNGDAAAIATLLNTFKFSTPGLPPALCGGGTNPGPAIVTATNNFGAHPGNRQVIDLSTDGQFGGIANELNFAQNNGVDTLNALGFGGGVNLGFLQGIIFGPQAFAQVVPNVQAFVTAIQNKIISEIQPVGGEIIPINTAALLLAGAQTNAVWIMSALAVVGTMAFSALYITTKKR